MAAIGLTFILTVALELWDRTEVVLVLHPRLADFIFLVDLFRLLIAIYESIEALLRSGRDPVHRLCPCTHHPFSQYFAIALTPTTNHPSTSFAADIVYTTSIYLLIGSWCFSPMFAPTTDGRQISDLLMSG